MVNLSIINILPNRVADIYTNLKIITSKLYMNDGKFINYWFRLVKSIIMLYAGNISDLMSLW